MQITDKVKALCADKETEDALAAGKGNRFVGASETIGVGYECTLEKIKYVTDAYFKPEDMTDEEWNSLSREEQSQKGRNNHYFAIITNKGRVSLTSILQPHKDIEKWDEGKAEINDVDDLSEVIAPKTTNVEQFIEKEFPRLKGKKIRCIATTTQKASGRQRFDITHKLFAVCK